MPGRKTATLDARFYQEKSWGSLGIKEGKDLPTLKLRYLMELLRKRKRRDARLLEIGCGSGRILASLRARDPDIRLTGVDLSEGQIALARKDNAGKRITFVAGNGERLPFRASSFDYVIFLDVIEHVERPDALLREAARVLREGGLLYGVSPAEGQGIYALSARLFGRHFKEETAGHIQRYTIEDLLRRVERQGLAVEEVKYSYHFLGSLMDYALFTLMLNRRIAKAYWDGNRYYATTRTKRTPLSRALNAVLALGNAIAYCESRMLRNVRLTATAVHVVARKMGKPGKSEKSGKPGNF